MIAGAALLVMPERLFAADSKEADQILFLHLRLKDGAITLVKTGLRPGVLKRPRDNRQAGEILFEMATEEGAVLRKGSLKDPSVQRLEYEDPANPGQFQVKEIRLNDVEFTLRLSHQPSARRVRFFRLATTEPGAAKQNAQPSLIGTIELPTAAEAAP